MTYQEYLDSNPDSSAAQNGTNTSGVLGNLLTSLVQTGGQYLVAKETVKGITAANTVKTQAQIDAENRAYNATAQTATTTKTYLIYAGVAVAAVIAISLVLKNK